MPIGNSTIPDYVSGMSTPSSYINIALSLLEFMASSNIGIRIVAQPATIIPGVRYLIGAGSTYGTPGTVTIFLNTTAASAQVFNPPDGTVINGWVKYLGNWVNTEFKDGSLVFFTTSTSQSITLPNDFHGVCTLQLETTGAGNITAIIGASGVTANGTNPTGLTTGMYIIAQDLLANKFSYRPV
jgi:hypothetical protein